MKKLLAFLLALFLMTGAFACAESDILLNMSELTVAELQEIQRAITSELTRRTISPEISATTSDAPILFRGYPWFSSETEMLANLSSLGYTSTTHGEGAGYTEVGSWEINLKENFYEEESLLSNREIGYWVFIPLSNNTKVAGFPIRGISMDFLYGHDASKVYRDREHSRMYAATYLFSVAEPMSAYTALKAKMSALYGTPVEVTAEGGSYTVYHAFWYGAENTGVRLDMRIAKGNSNPAYALQLCYGISNSLELIADLQNAITNEILAQGSMDGL